MGEFVPPNAAAPGARVSRRTVLGAGAAAMGAVLLPTGVRAVGAAPRFDLTARPASVPLAGPQNPATALWTFGGDAPGPVLRARQGDRLRVAVRNDLPEPTTVHFHGIRMPNAMDGVPFLTQPPIPPGASFTYEFDLTDAGTFWYHPHANSAEQVGRGLHGALIVDETEPPPVDRDVLWVLDDWRLTEAAQLAAFGGWHDPSHAGRIGNTVTINGRLPDAFALRAGERVRLRLVNAANARVFGLEFEGHDPWLVAIDGHPVAPRALGGGQLVIGPGSRADLILDATAQPGTTHRIVDRYYARFAYELVSLAYEDAPPLRAGPPEPPDRLPDNPLARPALKAAEHREFVLAGGAMGGMRSALLGGRRLDMRGLAEQGMFWAIDGVVRRPLDDGYRGEPLATLRRGASYRFTLRNDSAFDHPMHLHGHSFLVTARNRDPVPDPAWHDTVLVPPQESVDIAFVADNPGDWMFHCHVLEHQHSGMMGYVRVE